MGAQRLVRLLWAKSDRPSSVTLPPMLSTTSSAGTLLEPTALKLVFIKAAFTGLPIASQSALVFANVFFYLYSFLIKMLCGTESSSMEK